MQRWSAASKADHTRGARRLLAMAFAMAAVLVAIDAWLLTTGHAHISHLVTPVACILPLAASGAARHRRTMRALVDDVWLEHDRVHMRRGETQQDIALHDILYVRLSTRFHRATLMLRWPGPLGGQASFTLPPKGTDAWQFVVRDLPLRIEEAAWQSARDGIS